MYRIVATNILCKDGSVKFIKKSVDVKDLEEYRACIMKNRKYLKINFIYKKIEDDNGENR